MFDGLLNAYCSAWKLNAVKTTNMGSLFRLTYEVTLRQNAREKEFMDQLRQHNGNLEISLAQGETLASDL